MATIQAQLAWEETMVQHGVERYRAQQDSAVEGGRETETSVGTRLMRTYVLQIADHIKLYLAGHHPEGRRRGKWAKLLDTLDTDKAAMLALKAVIATLFNPQTLQTLCINIGKVIEDDIRFMQFETEHSAYYAEIIRKFEERGSTDYRYQRRSLANASNTKEFVWDDWTHEAHFGVGSLILGLLMEASDLIEKTSVTVQKKGKRTTEVVVAPTQACIDWVMEHNETMELASPDRMPCIVPPEDWTGLYQGGYYSPAIRNRSAFVKMRAGKTSKAQAELYNNTDMTRVYSAVNAMQRTAWEINTAVFECMKDVWHRNIGIGMPRSQPYEMPTSPLPPEIKPAELEDDDPLKQVFHAWKADMREIHTLERERIAKNLALMRTIRMATAMQAHDVFYYVYQCDFRGRVYSATAGLSPQGTDQSKALLRFSEGKALGEAGLYWLKVHGANKYGYDKEDYDIRVKWIDDQQDKWAAVAADPVNNRKHWEDADKPYQFLAFCYEYAAAMKVGPTFVSHLPVALDGSCNGLQHLSAMLRDKVGGAAVNLVPSDKPADIYQEVADVCTRKIMGLRSLNDERHGGAVNWMALFEELNLSGMPRKLSKTPVMTLPYGSTQQACTSTIFKWSHENAPTFFEKGTGFRHAIYLSPILWESISEVVIAARAAMDWIQDCAAVLAKAGHAVQYTSPLGFPVYQATYEFKTKCIETQISGRVQLRIAKDTNKLSVRKARQGSSPHMTHHSDACHMQMVLNAGAAAGMTSFAMIHDDFGTHACDIPEWHGIIRDTFVQLHTEQDILADFKRVHEARHDITLPDLPAKGDLDLELVKQSKFMFG